MSANPDPQDELQRMLALKRNEAPPPRAVSGIARAVRDGIHTPPPEAPLPPTARLREFLSSRPVQISLIGIVSIGGLAVGILASRDVTPPRPIPPSGEHDLERIVAAPAASHVATPPKAGNASSVPPLPSLGQPAVVSDGVADNALRATPASVTNSNTATATPLPPR